MGRTTKTTSTATNTDASTDAATAAGTAIGAVEVVQVAPAELLVDVNVRHDARLDRDFVASIREHGVLVPVVAVRTSGGGLRVRFGHRRTLAAVEAGLPMVPVVVAADEAATDAGQVERLVGQYAENEHRTGLTAAERVDVAAQLAAFGVTPAQIARKTRMPRPLVDQALAVAGSDLAKAATARYDLTIDQAAVIAEFDTPDDPDAVETIKALVAAANTGMFDHVAQRARDRRDETRARTAAEAHWTGQGLRILTRDQARDTGAQTLRDLLATPEATEPLTVDTHAGCPGHAAWLEERYEWDPAPAAAEQTGDNDDVADDDDTEGDDGADPDDTEEGAWVWVPVYVCTDPDTHGHHRRWGRPSGSTGAGTGRVPANQMTDKQREAARAARREVIDCNKAWESATTVRREFLTGYLTRKTAPKGTATFLALAAAHDADVLASIGGNAYAADLLGCDATPYGRNRALTALVEQATEARAQVIHLAMTLAAYEDATSREDWRRPNPRTARYLTHLATLGYTLSEVEQRACTVAADRSGGTH